MSVTNIFIVVASGGGEHAMRYSNVCAFVTQEEADLDVIRRYEMQAKLASLDKMASLAHLEYLQNVSVELEEPDPQPKMPAQLNKKSREEYAQQLAKWHEKNYPMIERNRSRHAARSAKASEHARQAVISAGATKEELELLGFGDNANTVGYDFSNDTTFSVERIELINSI